MTEARRTRELHLDGLRIDATRNVHDRTEPHVPAEITRAVREAAGGRSTIVVAENQPRHPVEGRRPHGNPRSDITLAE